jgi:hypothetical protein
MLCGVGWQLVVEVSGQPGPLKMGKIGYPEASVSSCQPTPHNASEEQKPLLHRGCSLTSPINNEYFSKEQQSVGSCNGHGLCSL